MIISTKNSKLGGQIAQVNMPAVLTCRPDAPCYAQCYARKGNFAFPKVKDGLMKRLDMYKENPVAFFDIIDSEMKLVTYKYFRWHSSGDIVDMQYLHLMCKLARKHRETMFLCFTKQYEIVNEYLDSHKKPNNLVLVLSCWGNWIPSNPHNLPTSWVDFKDETARLIPSNANECHGNCGECVNTSEHCWRMRKGDSVCFHKH